MSDTGEHQAMVQGASNPDTDVISAARVRGSRPVLPIFTIPILSQAGCTMT
jgi:hypothetical protein